MSSGVTLRPSKRIVPTLVHPEADGSDHSTVSLEDFSGMIGTTIESTSNDRRRHAESQMARLKSSNPNLYFQHLCQIMTNQRFSTPLRSLAAILLRQTLGVTDDMFDQLSDTTQLNVQRSLIEAVMNEPNRSVVVQISHCLSQCAVHLLCQRRKWDELMPAVFRLAESGNQHHFESFLIVIAKLAEFTIDLLRPRFEKIRGYLVRALKTDGTPPTIKKAAMKASVNIFLGIDSKKELIFWTEITPLLFENISFEAGDDVISKTCEDLHDLVENRPEFLADCMAPVVRCLCKAIDDDRIDWDARRLCMGLLITLLQHNIDHVNRNEVAKQVIPLVFKMCESIDIDILDHWKCPEDDGEQVTMSYGASVAQQLPDILSPEIFLKHAFPLIMRGLQASSTATSSIIHSSSIHPAWVRNCGALSMIEHIMSSVSHLWSDKLDSIVSVVGRFITATTSSEHTTSSSGSSDSISTLSKVSPALATARLRYAALRVVKQLAVTFSEEGFQERFHEPVVASLVSFLNSPSSQHHCVLVQAADTLAHFAFGCERDTFESYASDALGCLYSLISDSFGQIRDTMASETRPMGGVPPAVLSLLDVCFKCVSVIITVLESGFDTYYSRFLRLCVDVLSHSEGASKQHLSLIRGRSIECVSQMMSNVSFDLCNKDAHRVVQMLMRSLKAEHQSGSVSYNYLIKFFSRMAELMGGDFKPYLSSVVPCLLESCKLQPISTAEVSGTESSSSALSSKVGPPSTTTVNDDWLVSSHDISDKENSGDAGNGSVAASTGIGPGLSYDGTTLTRTVKIHGDLSGTEKQIRVNTNDLEEKVLAIDGLVTLLTCVGPLMIDYFKPIVALFLPILRSVNPNPDSKSPLTKESLNNSDGNMRRLVCEAIPPLCICLREGLETVKGLPMREVYSNTSSFLNEVLPLLVECMESEDEVEGVAALCGYLKDILEVVQSLVHGSSSSSASSSDDSKTCEDMSPSMDPRHFIKQELFSDLIQQLSNVVSERILRHLNCDKDTSDDDFLSRNPDLSYSEEVEALLANSLTDLFAVLACIFKDKFVEPFDRHCLQAVSELLVTVTPASSDTSSSGSSGGSTSNGSVMYSDVALGISILTEVTMHGGELAAKKYGPNLLQICQRCLTKSLSIMEEEETGDKVIDVDSCDLIHSVCYAVGVIASVTGSMGDEVQLLQSPRTLAAVSDWLSYLLNIVQLTRMQREDEVMCRENAVSAIGKVLKYHGKYVSDERKVAGLARSWICDMLPLTNDVDERIFCNEFFVDCFKRWGQQWLDKEASDKKLISKAVEIVAVAVEDQDQNADLMKPVLGLITARCGKEVVSGAVATLPGHLKEALSS